MKVKPESVRDHQHLLELRERSQAQISGLAKESAEEMTNYSLHMADSGTDNFDRDFALSLLSSDQDAVYEIEEALKRIEKKTYGICELSGKTDPQDPHGSHSVDAIYGRGAEPAGAGRGAAHPPWDNWARWTPPAGSIWTREKKSKKSRSKTRNNMPREIITIECTEARKEGKSPSRYTTTRNKKLKTEKLEIKKYNPALRRHTVHREVK